MDNFIENEIFIKAIPSEKLLLYNEVSKRMC